uniref:beta-N-acetylhexosaminidase n=1 Tax=Heligmosomoides polygyrus TaxID=6339 RepID=A0A8L8Q118_HELPZ
MWIRTRSIWSKQAEQRSGNEALASGDLMASVASWHSALLDSLQSISTSYTQPAPVSACADARTVQGTAVDKAVHPLPDESKEYGNHEHGAGVQAEGAPLPIIKNEDGDGVDPDRVDGPDAVAYKAEQDQEQMPAMGAVAPNDVFGRQPVANARAADNDDDSSYPRLNSNGKFIPHRRIVHLDLKGGAFKPEFFTEIFYYLNRIKATGILIEWEDMFPYRGNLSLAVNGNAYSIENVDYILQQAKRHHLEVIPLVQTFGHLEWILKLERFAHLREDERFPQVICFPEPEAWNLITDMIDQVAEVHKRYGMPFFHMGADEAFQIGICNASLAEMGRQGSRDRLMLWHISRVAKYIKDKYSTTVLAWHDMFGHAIEFDLAAYHMADVLEPVVWSYAEDLDLYLPKTTWLSLKAWVEQMSRNYNEFDSLQGLILAGWSRYDHLAILCELAPVAFPTLAMSMETILACLTFMSLRGILPAIYLMKETVVFKEGRPLNGNYPVSRDILQCTPSTTMGITYGCQFPGHKVYELINEFWQRRKQLQQYKEDDFELNGWLSRVADTYMSSSQWYIDETVDEFMFTYMAEDIAWVQRKIDSADRISKLSHFPKRPFVVSKSHEEL